MLSSQLKLVLLAKGRGGLIRQSPDPLNLAGFRNYSSPTQEVPAGFEPAYEACSRVVACAMLYLLATGPMRGRPGP